MEYLLMTLLVITNCFFIVVILIQRGRGGGLAGAFGGMGGQSAFGTKAGDVFTKITIGVAAFWFLLCAFCVVVLSNTESKFTGMGKNNPASAPAATGTETVKPDATGKSDATEKSESKSEPKSEPAPKSEAPAAGTKPAETPPAEAAPSESTPAAPAESSK